MASTGIAGLWTWLGSVSLSREHITESEKSICSVACEVKELHQHTDPTPGIVWILEDTHKPRNRLARAILLLPDRQGRTHCEDALRRCSLLEECHNFFIHRSRSSVKVDHVP